MSFLSDTLANSFKQTYVNGFLDCSGNVLLRAGNVIIGNLDYPAFNINNKSLHVNGGTTFNGNVTINSSTTTSSFLSISSQTGNSIAIGRGAVANGGNSIAIGNVALINGFTNSVAIGAGASCSTNNQIVLGTASQSVSHLGTTSLVGATTATGLITANGGLTMGGANNITLGSGATAPTSLQLGYSIIQSGVSVGSVAKNTTATLSTITNLPIGTWIITFSEFNPSFAGTAYIDGFIEIASVNVCQSSSVGISGTSNIAVTGSLIYVNTSIQNILLRVTNLNASTGVIFSLDFTFSAARIA